MMHANDKTGISREEEYAGFAADLRAALKAADPSAYVDMSDERVIIDGDFDYGCLVEQLRRVFTNPAR